MKKKILFFGCFLLLFACKKEIIAKPNKFIDKKTMMAILYDLAILDALKYHETTTLSEKYKANPLLYIQQKYKVDSLQFVSNNKYYAANYNDYLEMYDQINEKVTAQKKVLEIQINKEYKQRQKLNLIKNQNPANFKKDSIEKAKINATQKTIQPTPEK